MQINTKIYWDMQKIVTYILYFYRLQCYLYNHIIFWKVDRSFKQLRFSIQSISYLTICNRSQLLRNVVACKSYLQIYIKGSCIFNTEMRTVTVLLIVRLLFRVNKSALRSILVKDITPSLNLKLLFVVVKDLNSEFRCKRCETTAMLHVCYLDIKLRKFGFSKHFRVLR